MPPVYAHKVEYKNKCLYFKKVIDPALYLSDFHSCIIPIIHVVTYILNERFKKNGEWQIICMLSSGQEITISIAYSDEEEDNDANFEALNNFVKDWLNRFEPKTEVDLLKLG